MTTAMYEQFGVDVDSGESCSDRDAYHQTLAAVVSIRAGRAAVNPYMEPMAPKMDESNPHWPEWVELVESKPVQGC